MYLWVCVCAIIYYSIVLYHLFICPKLPLPIHHGADDTLWTDKSKDTLGGTSCSKYPGIFGSASTMPQKENPHQRILQLVRPPFYHASRHASSKKC